MDPSVGGEFFWLLQNQKDATLFKEQSSGISKQGGAPGAARNAGPQDSDEVEAGAASTRLQGFDGAAQSSAAAAVLHALACSAADVPGFLQRHGFGGHAAGTALAAACSEALLAVLQQPAAALTAVISYGPNSAGRAPQPMQVEQLGGDEVEGEAAEIQEQQGEQAGAEGVLELDLAAEATEAAGETPEPLLAGGPPQPQQEQEREQEAPASALAAAAHEAVAVHGVIFLVARLLQLGADANYAAADGGMTVLAAALSGEHLEAAGLLLDAGSHPDAPATDPSTTTAAIASASATACGGAAAGAQSRGAGGGGEAQGAAGGGGNAGSKRKRAPAAAEQQQVGERSTQKSVPQGATSVQCCTPLVLAIAAGSRQLVGRLLLAGADPNRTCSLAAAGDATTAAAAAVAAATTLVTVTPLVVAINLGSMELVQQLLKAGADVNQKVPVTGSSGGEWTSALSAAVQHGSLPLVQVLVDAGACRGRNGGQFVSQDHPVLQAVALAARCGRVDLLNVLYPPLVAALQGGSVAMVGTLRRRTALHPLAAAAERGHVAAVQRLLELGAPVNHAGSTVAGVAQMTALMPAAGNGHMAVVDCLLAAGACPLKLNARQQTAASLALQRGQLAVLRRLLEHTGELAAQQEQASAGTAGTAARSRPQLTSASKAWHAAFASGGMLPGARPLSLAALEQERQRYQLLVLALLDAHAAASGSGAPAAGAGGSGSGSPVNAVSASGGAGAAATPSSSSVAAHAAVRQLASPASLAAAAAAGSDALLEHLLACGASITGVDPADGSFPLLAACYLGWDALLCLLRHGANVNQADSGGRTALMRLAERPAMLDTARQLLSWHASRQQQAQQQQAQQQQAQQQQGQQQHGPQLLNLLQRSADGRDAVGVAVAAKNRRFAELLLQQLVAEQQQQARPLQPAQPAAATAADQHAGQAAGPADSTGAWAAAASRAYDMLCEAGALCMADINKPDSHGQHPLVSQIPVGSRKQVRQVLMLPGIDINARDPGTGRTPLMLAASRQQPALVSDILSTGRVDLEARDNRGSTALLLAAKAGDGVTLRTLLDAGADPDCCDSHGETPLMALARLGQHRLLTQLLREHGQAACVNRQDANGWTALHHAAASGSMNACRVLRNYGADPALLTAGTEGGGKTALDLAAESSHATCLPLLKAPPTPDQNS